MTYNALKPNVYEDMDEIDDIMAECKLGRSDRRFKRKKELVKLKGGGCETCGYNKTLRALDFHHPDPTKKAFNMSFALREFTNKQYRHIVIPHVMDFTILLCANCHREIHHKKRGQLL